MYNIIIEINIIHVAVVAEYGNVKIVCSVVTINNYELSASERHTQIHIIYTHCQIILNTHMQINIEVRELALAIDHVYAL